MAVYFATRCARRAALNRRRIAIELPSSGAGDRTIRAPMRLACRGMRTTDRRRGVALDHHGSPQNCGPAKARAAPCRRDVSIYITVLRICLPVNQTLDYRHLRHGRYRNDDRGAWTLGTEKDQNAASVWRHRQRRGVLGGRANTQASAQPSSDVGNCRTGEHRPFHGDDRSAVASASRRDDWETQRWRLVPPRWRW